MEDGTDDNDILSSTLEVSLDIKWATQLEPSHAYPNKDKSADFTFLPHHITIAHWLLLDHNATQRNGEVMYQQMAGTKEMTQGLSIVNGCSVGATEFCGTYDGVSGVIFHFLFNAYFRSPHLSSSRFIFICKTNQQHLDLGANGGD